jgi:hypothetical protein
MRNREGVSALILRDSQQAAGKNEFTLCRSVQAVQFQSGPENGTQPTLFGTIAANADPSWVNPTEVVVGGWKAGWGS